MNAFCTFKANDIFNRVDAALNNINARRELDLSVAVTHKMSLMNINRRTMSNMTFGLKKFVPVTYVEALEELKAPVDFGLSKHDEIMLLRYGKSANRLRKLLSLLHLHFQSNGDGGEVSIDEEMAELLSQWEA